MIRVPEFFLTIPGKPVTQARQKIDTRGHRPRTFAAPATEVARTNVYGAWLQAGSPTIRTPAPDRAYWCIEVTVLVERPRAHFNRAGELNAEGLRTPRPGGFDLDNVVKVVVDTLVKARAVSDDRYCTHMALWKDWAGGAEDPGTMVRVWRIETPGGAT